MSQVKLAFPGRSALKSFVNLFLGSLLIFILLFLTLNCNDKKNETSSKPAGGEYKVNDETEPVSDPAQVVPYVPKTLVVKGLYIDMPAQDAYNKLFALSPKIVIEWTEGNIQHRIFAETGRIGTVDLSTLRMTGELPISEFVPLESVKVWDTVIKFDKIEEILLVGGINLEILNKWAISKNDITIHIKKGKVSTLIFECNTFNACDLTAGGFAQDFLKNYKLPKLDSFNEGVFGNGWAYESDFGWKVLIYIGKIVTIEKIASKVRENLMENTSKVK